MKRLTENQKSKLVGILIPLSLIVYGAHYLIASLRIQVITVCIAHMLLSYPLYYILSRMWRKDAA